MVATDIPASLLREADPALSIYLPMETGQRDLRAPEARLRNLIEIAAERLAQTGADARRRGALLAPLQERARGLDFAAHRAPGFAFFVADGGCEMLEVAGPDEELVVLGRSFHIRPLLRTAARNLRFYILAVSADNACLIQATPFAMREIELEPQDATARAELDSMPAADRKGRDAARRRLLAQSPPRLDAAIRHAVANDPALIILAGDPRATGQFAKASGLDRILPQALHLNPFGIPRSELQRQAVELIMPALEEQELAVLSQAAARLGTAEPTVSVRLEDILKAGAEGRIDAVVIAEGERVWGRFQKGEAIVAHGKPNGADEDLLNLAAVLALRGGGRAFARPRADLPRQVAAVATLRF